MLRERINAIKNNKDNVADVRQEIFNEIYNYAENLEDVEYMASDFADEIADDFEVRHWNQYVDNCRIYGDEVYDMSEFDDIMADYSPTEIVDKTKNGYFDINDDLFKFDGLENLESMTEYDFRDTMYDDDDFMEWYTMTYHEEDLREKIYEERKEVVELMDEFLREYIDDEEVFMIWLTYGVPDGADESDYDFFANDDDEYEELVDLFNEVYERDNEEC